MGNIAQLPRSWLDDKIVSQPDFLRAMVYLAREINDKGSVEFSSGDAKLRFGMSPRRYRTFMSLITGDKQADKQATNKTTSISFELQAVATPKRQAKRQASDKRETAKFIPPTDEEVSRYVAEKGYHFNPEQFIPHYQSKGWKVGKEPMKDWRSACRTWEATWKERHGEQFYYQLSNGTAKATNITKGRYAAEREANRQRVDNGLRAAMDVVARENGF